ncbi:putative oxidoreductase [Mycena amicta]|nr:putative oxidoreductase [Mycena amicta]
MSDDQVITAYPNFEPQKQEQNLPGKDKAMEPLAEHTRIEKWDENGQPYLEEYVGSGKLKNKKAHILISGSDSGIGKSVAICAAREGADVTVVYLVEEHEDAENTQSRIEKEGRTCLLVSANLMNDAECKHVVEQHITRFGRIDVLINNASKQIQCPDLAEIDLDNVRSTFNSNIVGMIALTKFALPPMKRGCTIVNSSSVTAYRGSTGMVDYSATKGASALLRCNSCPKNIRVNAVTPGPVYTPLQPASRSGEQMEGWGAGVIPLHKRVAQPAEMASSYIFLASADSNQITGSVVHNNSGSHMGGS